MPKYLVFFITTIVQVWGQRDFIGSKCTLHILSVLPYPKDTPPYNTDYSDGPDIVPAGYLAAEMINNRSDILKDYYLELIEGHDGCGNIKSTPVENLLVQNIFYSGKNIVGIAGPRCYTSAAVAGLITAKDGIALVNVHTSSLFKLGNKNLYPYSFGATPSIERFVEAYVALIKLNKWKHVGILYQDDAGAYSVFESLNSKLSQMSGYVMSFSSVITESYLPLDSLQASSARAIIMISASSNLATMLMCIAFTKGAVFPQYQWTFLYNEPAEIVDIAFEYGGTPFNCSRTNLLQALENSILISVGFEPHSGDWNKTGISGLTYPQYKQEYARAIERYNNGFYGPPVRIANTTLWGNPFHDAIWILALALNATDTRLKEYNKSLCDFTYGQPSMTLMIQEEISRLDFLGVGGRIVYSNFSKFTPGMVTMWQVIWNTLQPLGNFNEEDFLQITALNNGTFLHLQEQKFQLNSALSVIFLIFSIIAVIFTAVFNVLNIIFRHHDSVKASSHRLNHLAYAGVYLLSMSVIMLTLTEGFSLRLSVKNIICNGVPWVSSIGFTAVYATVAVKLFRIYRLLIVMVENLQKPSESKMMRDSVLLAAIAALIVPDIVICAVWQCVDPIIVKSLTLIQKDRIIAVYVTYESCFMHSSRNLLPWMLSIFIYNGILCCIAAFLAFLTRSISMRNFQTGNILLISAFQFILCGVALPTLAILNINTPEHANFILSVYVTTCVLLMCSVYLCLFLLFLPPLYPIIKHALLHARQSLELPAHVL